MSGVEEGATERLGEAWLRANEAFETWAATESDKALVNAERQRTADMMRDVFRYGRVLTQ